MDRIAEQPTKALRVALDPLEESIRVPELPSLRTGINSIGPSTMAMTTSASSASSSSLSPLRSNSASSSSDGSLEKDPSAPKELARSRHLRKPFPRCHLWKWTKTTIRHEAADATGQSLAMTMTTTTTANASAASTSVSNSNSNSSGGNGTSTSIVPAANANGSPTLGKKKASQRQKGQHTKDVDVWKTYKLAHRMNRIMARSPRGTTNRDPNGSSRGRNEFGGALANGAVIHDPAKAGTSETDPSFAAKHMPKYTQEEFEREFLQEELEDEELRQREMNFWQVFKEAGNSKNRPNSSRGRYINKCEHASLLVLPILDLKATSPESLTEANNTGVADVDGMKIKSTSRRFGNDGSLSYDNYFLGDQRAEAFGDALHLLPVEVKSLSMKNVGLTGPGSASIVEGIPMHQLTELSFAQNRIGLQGTTKLFHALQDSRFNLLKLDLCNNLLGDQCVHLLMRCLVSRCTLESLNLSRNQIFQSAKTIGELLCTTTPLRELDLSWNNIRGDPAVFLAKSMVENTSLWHLDLSDNSLGNAGGADVALANCLASNKTLKCLNLSNNQIHGKCVMIYVHALQQNHSLDQLALCGNPIGVLGTEVILRAIATDSIRCQLDISDCNLEIQETSLSTGQFASTYQAPNCGGNYTLNLADMCDLIFLKQLLTLFASNRLEFVDVTLNGNATTSLFTKQKDVKTLFQAIPSTGILTLKSQPSYENAGQHDELLSDGAFARIVDLLTRSCFANEDNLLFCVRSLAGESCVTLDQANCLLALFKNHTAQLEKASAAAALVPQILKKKKRRGSGTTAPLAPAGGNGDMAGLEVGIEQAELEETEEEEEEEEEVLDCATLNPDVFFEDIDGDGKIDVCGDICMVIGLTNLSAVEQAQVEKKVGKWISFNPRNPTGRYRLNVANSIDRRIMMRILQANHIDRKFRQQYKLVDTSEQGNFQGGFRNVRINHCPSVVDANWSMPHTGVIDFDFVVTRRPYSACTALCDAAFERFLKEFKSLAVNAEMKLIGLRAISTRFFFTCAQVQRLMEHFGTFERDPVTGSLYRAEVFIILFARIIDESNFTEALALVDLATKRTIAERLGFLNVFWPLVHLESFELHLTRADQRQLATWLVKLAVTNEGELSNVLWNGELCEQEIWKKWTNDEMPKDGTFCCTLKTNVQSEAHLPPNSLRKKLLQGLYFKLETREQQSM